MNRAQQGIADHMQENSSFLSAGGEFCRRFGGSAGRIGKI